MPEPSTDTELIGAIGAYTTHRPRDTATYKIR